jgi:hypothetical protein
MHQIPNVPAIRTPQPPGKHDTSLSHNSTDSNIQVGRLSNLRLKRSQELRDQHEDGKLLLETRGAEESFLPRDAQGNPKTGFSDNWWIGMELLHTLFALEHNAICDKIRGAHLDWTG